MATTAAARRRGGERQETPPVVTLSLIGAGGAARPRTYSGASAREAFHAALDGVAAQARALAAKASGNPGFDQFAQNVADVVDAARTLPTSELPEHLEFVWPNGRARWRVEVGA